MDIKIKTNNKMHNLVDYTLVGAEVALVSVASPFGAVPFAYLLGKKLEEHRITYDLGDLSAGVMFTAIASLAGLGLLRELHKEKYLEGKI